MHNLTCNNLNNQTNYLNNQSAAPFLKCKEKENLTPLFQSKVLNEQSQKSVEDASLAHKSIKVGKKKKKKPSAEKEGVVIQMLGNSFALPDVKPQQASSKVSLFTQTYCPTFLEEEQKGLTELLAGSAFCANITLYEVFLMDFYALWTTIIESAGSCDEKAKIEVNKFNSMHTLIPGLYKTYLIINEKTNKEFKILNIDLEALDSSFYPSIPDIIEWLNSYANAIPTLILSIKQIQIQKNSAMKARGIKSDYCEIKFKPLYATLNLLKFKVELFNKCLKGKEMSALMIQAKTIQWSESECENNAEISANYIKKFAQFVKSFAFTKNSSSSAMNTLLISHFALLEKIISTNFSKNNTSEFLSSFRQYSNYIVEGRIYLLDRLTNAKFSPSEAKSKFSKNLNRPTENISHNQFFTRLFNANLDTNMFDKWINDLHQTISCRFLLDFREVHLSNPQAHFNRLLMMIELINTNSETEIDPIVHSNPLLASVQDLVQTLAAQKDTQLKHIFEPFNLLEIADKIRELLSSSSFRLSECLLPLIPLIKEFERQNISALNLNQIRLEILSLIRNSKENHSGDKVLPEDLKIEIQKIVFKSTFSICTYCMIFEDIKVLSTQSATKEVNHLLPNELVKLLDLTGLDEILAEYADCQNSVGQESNSESMLTDPSSSAVENNFQAMPSKKVNIHTSHSHTSPSAPLLLKVSQVSKSIQIPTKEDFKSRKVQDIRDLLERLGFVWARTKGSHRTYKHSITNGQVVLPNSLEANGTRKSVFNQVMGALS